MIIKIQYIDSIDRQNKIDSNKDKILIEEQNIIEGNFLIFSDVKPLENQLIELQENQQTIKDGMADMYMLIASIPGVVL